MSYKFFVYTGIIEAYGERVPLRASLRAPPDLGMKGALKALTKTVEDLALTQSPNVKIPARGTLCHYLGPDTSSVSHLRTKAQLHELESALESEEYGSFVSTTISLYFLLPLIKLLFNFCTF